MSILIQKCNRHFDYAIVKRRCFGVSTALVFKREWPDARIIWFEGTATHTAFKNITKIIRTLYPDKNYIAFVEQTMRMWEEAVFYRHFFHRTPWVQVIGVNNDRNIMKKFKNRLISTQELVHMIRSQKNPKLGTGEELWFNEDIGYVDSALAVEAVAEETSKFGVTKETKDVTRLIVKKKII